MALLLCEPTKLATPLWVLQSRGQRACDAKFQRYVPISPNSGNFTFSLSFRLSRLLRLHILFPTITMGGISTEHHKDGIMGSAEKNQVPSSRTSTLSSTDPNKTKPHKKLGFVNKFLHPNDTPSISRHATIERNGSPDVHHDKHKVSAAHTPSVASAVESMSLQSKYGVCEKGTIGKGATAVVRLAHKLDKTSNTEKLYAVKEYRKRRKGETEKAYMKKLTSEFCISSTFRHKNIVETVDLVMDEQKRWCIVMEYVSHSISVFFR